MNCPLDDVAFMTGHDAETPVQRQSSGQRSRSGRHRFVFYLVWWMVLFGVWLVLVDSLAHPEVGAAPLAALIALLAVYGIARSSRMLFHLRVRELQALGTVPAGIVRDTCRLAVALWRHLVLRERARGRFRVVPFTSPTGEAEATAWRAFATIATSVAPNTYVIGIDRERNTVLVHQLVPDPASRLRKNIVGVDPSQREGGSE